MSANLGDTTSTCSIELLNFHARVVGPTPIIRELGRYAAVTPKWAIDGGSGKVSRVYVVDDGGPSKSRYSVTRSGKTIWASGHADEVFPFLESTINAAAIEHSSGYFLLHAGAVTFQDRGVIFPAPGRSGKSSLVAALLGSGRFLYFSDEVAALDTQHHHLIPFAKSIAIREGAVQPLTPFLPGLAELGQFRRPDGDFVRFVAPRPEWVSQGPTQVRYVILPKYEPGADLRLLPIRRSNALKTILSESFNLQQYRAAGVSGVAKILEGAECFSLVFSDIGSAVRCVVSEVAPELERERPRSEC